MNLWKLWIKLIQIKQIIKNEENKKPVRKIGLITGEK